MPDTRAMFDDLVNAIRSEVRAEFMSALGAEGAAPAQSVRGRPGPKPSMKPRPKGAKRAAGDIEQLTQLLAGFIKKNPGSRSEQIADGLGVMTRDLVLPTKKLIADKAIKTVGQRRGTKYFAK